MNLFCVGAAREEVDVIRRLLQPLLYRFYETPGAAKTHEIAAKVVRAVADQGFSDAHVLTGAGRSTLVCIVGSA